MTKERRLREGCREARKSRAAISRRGTGKTSRLTDRFVKERSNVGGGKVEDEGEAQEEGVGGGRG